MQVHKYFPWTDTCTEKPVVNTVRNIALQFSLYCKIALI
jgi:hypothetical protein